MTTPDAIKLLREYNEWRRGSVLEQPHPTEIGIALDIVLNSIENATQDHAQADTDTLQALKQRNDAISQLHTIQDLIVEVFEPNERPTTISEYRKLLEWNAGNGIHTCHDRCNRPACVLRRERDQAIEELEAWRSEKGPDGWWVKHEEYTEQKEHWMNANAVLRNQISEIRKRVEALIPQTNIPLSAAQVRVTAINQALDIINEVTQP